MRVRGRGPDTLEASQKVENSASSSCSCQEVTNFDPLAGVLRYDQTKQDSYQPWINDNILPPVTNRPSAMAYYEISASLVIVTILTVWIMRLFQRIYPWFSARKTAPRDCFGIREIFTDEFADLDIVVIHGIGADPDATWEWNHDGTKVNWLQDKDMLRKSLPKTRLLRYGYNSEWMCSSPLRQSLESFSQNFLVSLEMNRELTPERPLLLIGHCFGGILGIEAFNSAQAHTRHQQLAKSVIGFLFLGTPLQGASSSVTEDLPAQVEALIEAAENSELTTDPSLLRQMRLDWTDEQLLVRIRRFLGNCGLRKIEDSIVCFNEGEKSKKRKLYGVTLPDGFVVDPLQATLPGKDSIQMSKDHYMMNKFHGPKDPDYILLVGQIKRLRHEAAMRVRDFIASESAPAIDMIPLQSYPHFVGRKKEWSRIEHLLDKGHEAAIVGLAGTGKTQLAVEFSHWYRQQHPRHSILWLHAINQSMFMSDYVCLSHRLKVYSDEAIELQNMQAALDWLVDPRNGPWLLVIDNADEIGFLCAELDLSDAQATHRRRTLKDYIPRPKHGKILVTSQAPKAAEILVDSSTIVRLEQLSDPDATELLRRRLPSEAFDHDAAQALYAKIGGIPLALVQASALIAARPGEFDLSTYCQRLEEAEYSLLEEERPDPRRIHREHHSIVKVIQLSILTMPDENGTAKLCLGLLCMFCCQQIPRCLFERLLFPREELLDVLGKLEEYSLIGWGSKRERGDTIKIHGLVETAVKLWLRSCDMTQKLRNASILSLDYAFPRMDRGESTNTQELRIHAELVVQYEITDERAQKARVRLLENLAFGDSFRLDFEKAASRFAQVVETMPLLYGPNSETTLMARSFYADLILNTGDVEKGANLQSEALRACIKHLGTDNPTTRRVHYYMVYANNKIGRNAEALEQIEKLISMQEADPASSSTIRIPERMMKNDILSSLGRMDEAEASHEQLFNECRMHSYNATLEALSKFVRILEKQNKREKASDLCREVLGNSSNRDIEENFFPFTMCKVSFVYLLTDSGQYTEAITQGEEVLNLIQRIDYIHRQKETLRVAMHLAKAYKEVGAHLEAEQALEEAMGVCREDLGLFGAFLPGIQTIWEVAELLADQGEYDKAERWFREYYRCNWVIRGPLHIRTSIAALELATFLDRRSRKWESEGYLRHVMSSQNQRSNAEWCLHIRNLAILAKQQRQRHHISMGTRLLIFVLKEVKFLDCGMDVVILAWKVEGVKEIESDLMNWMDSDWDGMSGWFMGGAAAYLALSVAASVYL